MVFVDESIKNNFLMEKKKPRCESDNHEEETIIPSPQSQNVVFVLQQNGQSCSEDNFKCNGKAAGESHI